MPTPPVSPLIALLTAARVWDAELTAALRPLGLTTRKYGLLGHIRSSPDVSFSELARRSRISVQSAHVSIAPLVEAGLVDDATAHAGASSALRVTAAGEAVLAAAAEVVVALDERLEGELPVVVRAIRATVEGVADT